MQFNTKVVSSLIKVFPDEELSAPTYCRGSALQGEIFSFQVAYRTDRILAPVKIQVDSPLAEHIRLRKVVLSPVNLVCYDFDDDVLRRNPGLYPDPLVDFGDELKTLPFQWHALWVTVKIPSDQKGGEFPIAVIFSYTGQDGNSFRIEEKLQLKIIPTQLPKQRLIHTEWFHVDCLSHYYNVPVWSERHWQIVTNYLRSAADHGINMILTPLFTPPLDTAVGGERLTAQLVEVKLNVGRYSFSFERLQRWIDISMAAGIEYFEMSHFFTQWGAVHAPKIIASVNGEEQQLFGWDTDSTGPEYTAFLNALLPELTAWLRARKLEKKTYFHVSDEPQPEHLKTYGKAAALLREHLKDFPIIDALSSIEFYRQGLVPCPIPAIDHIAPFVAAEIPDLWTYYCCGQWYQVTNRFLHFPSARNRIAGILFYRYNVAGFLQWGFNFWNTQYSLRSINPWQVLDGGGSFPAGDAFQVYPGEDGQPVDSIRYEIFTEALQDQRALQLLEIKMGRKALETWLDQQHGRRITMTDYPRGEKNVSALREKINALLE